MSHQQSKADVSRRMELYRQFAASKLSEINAALPSEYRLTLVARNLEKVDSDIIVTQDDLGQVRAAIRALEGHDRTGN